MAKPQAGLGAKESFVRRHRTLFVGIFVLVPLIVLPLLLLYSIMKMEIWQQKYRLYAVYEQDYGFSSRTKVSMYGITIGGVEKSTLAGKNRIVLCFKVNKKYTPLVRKNTRAKLVQQNLVGDWEISLIDGPDGAPPVADGDTLGSEYSLRIDKLTDQVAGMMSNIDSLIRQITSGKGTVGKILTQDTLADQVTNILRNVNTITVQTIEMMKRSDSLIATLNQTGRDAAPLLDSVKNIMGSVQTIMGSFQTILGQVPVILEQVKGATGAIEPLMGQVQDELNQADIMMRGLQRNWLFEKAIGKPVDTLLRNDP